MKNMYVLGMLLFIGCKVDVGTNESEQFNVLPKTNNISFQLLSKNILGPSCVRCHDWANDEQKVLQRVKLGEPENSPLYSKVKSGQMPPSGPLSTKQISLIEKYIKNPTLRPLEVIPINSTFKSIQFHLIEKSCISCHGEKKYKGGISLSNYDKIVQNADDVLYYIEHGEEIGTPMPPIDPITGFSKMPLPTKEVINALKSWINEGMLNN